MYVSYDTNFITLTVFRWNIPNEKFKSEPGEPRNSRVRIIPERRTLKVAINQKVGVAPPTARGHRAEGRNPNGRTVEKRARKKDDGGWKKKHITRRIWPPVKSPSSFSGSFGDTFVRKRLRIVSGRFPLFVSACRFWFSFSVVVCKFDDFAMATC